MRQATLIPKACATNDGIENVADNKTKQSVDDEQPLDEVAMRAAEIHEVLTGLREFKNRIIDGTSKKP